MNTVESPCLHAALELFAAGYWPVAIRAKGERTQTGKTCNGKEPIGAGWGLERWTAERLANVINARAGRGVGLCLGPGRGPGGWLIDVEVDGEGGEESYLRLVGGEVVDTVAWESTRGRHRLFVVSGEHLLDLLARAGAKESAAAPGVYHLEALAGLELRVGGTKADGTVKQLQSVCPPTPGTDGTPREWACDHLEPSELPERAYALLEALGERQAVQNEPERNGYHHEANGHAERNGHQHRTSAPEDERKPWAYRMLDAEVQALASKTEGERHAQLLGCTMRLAGVHKAVPTEQEILAALHRAALACGMGRARLGEVGEAWRSALDRAEPRMDLRAGKGDQGAGASIEWVDADCATLAHVESLLDQTPYLWNLWIPSGAITAIGAPPGVGKTRIVAEWCARLYRGEPMPDGSSSSAPAGSRTLWLCYDRNWRGLIRTFKQYAVPMDAVLLPTHRDRPLTIPDIDSQEAVAVLKRFAEVHKPAAIVIDTTTYSSALNTGKPNEAKRMYDALMDVLADTGLPCLALFHLNKEGELLNRRALERVRVKIDITIPDPATPSALRIEVAKTDDKRPPAIGAVMHDDRVEYDLSPPETAELPSTRGRKPSSSVGLANFLREFLAERPAAVMDIINAARDAGLLKVPSPKDPKPSISPLYDARDWLERQGVTIEDMQIPRGIGRSLKAWGIGTRGAPDGDSEF